MSEARLMPVLFVGHGSPMNAVEDNRFTRGWSEVAARIPKPEAILSVSAHWFTQGSRITDSPKPKMIYDMYGFPEELYKVEYNAPGAPELAGLVKAMAGQPVTVDNSWGCDHGTWSVLCKMYPEADIPVLQLSVDRNSQAAAHFRLGQDLRALRERGVLILGSGNVVHNLSRVNWEMEDGYQWANEFDRYIREAVTEGRHEDVINFGKAGKSADASVPTPDHFLPLLHVLGASNSDDTITVFNNSGTLGALSMTSYLFE
ncbi:MAG: 4,5-DOPA dioxygenase extradiol [Clostridiales bacterium]|nr:4,5-DOPA dioxygenase extradiol [Clostridiales bacterium]